ncbi:MAG TPA: EAL domain-containing protein [Allosphingosinicella sp.]|nr:EAL domain-containing protein [Allosphingosinicella sp.]
MAAACLVGVTATLTGVTAPLENWLEERRNSLTAKPVSGEVVVVEIDARSLEEVHAWPWPRSIHGRLVDILREAGARLIVFDIDFSSQASDPQQDRAFGAAIRRARGRVVLPALLENASGQFGERVEALPTAVLREHAQIASIWIRLDSDLWARRVPYSVEIAGARRPSLAAYLAGRPSQRTGEIPIDWSYARETFPDISYTDVLNGRFDPNFFRNKSVLIGGTSTMLGDRFTVPNQGRIPGLFIQATASETIRRENPLPVGDWPALAAVCALIALALRGRRKGVRIALMTATGAATLAAPLLLKEYTPLIVGSAPALLAFVAAAMLQTALGTAANVTSRLNHAPGTLLPNLAAMTAMWSGQAATTVAVRVRNYLETTALLGPEAQSELLRKVADRLSLAAPDSPVFQIDDHSFAWRTRCSLDATLETLDGLSALFSGGIAIGERMVDVTIATGVCADPHLDVQTAVAAALLASDRAARRGISWSRYEPADDDEKWRISLLGEIDRAIEEGDVWVAYQPQFDLATGAIMGAEALARWRHPDHGEIRPELFIPILEENGRIDKLTLHVLRLAVSDFSTLDENLSVSVNISMRMIGRDRLLEPVRALLHEFGFEPRRLTLEITESAAISDPSHIDELKQLRALGVMISIDDFGTGQSTLSYLKTLPATELKIDRSFVQMIGTSRSDATMVESTVKLAHALGLIVVAEGVENAEVAAMLKSMECDIVQGYYTGRPAAFEEFRERMKAPPTLPVRAAPIALVPRAADKASRREAARR